MRRTEAKGRDALQRQVELYHDSSDAAKFDLVAELMSCSWASGFGCRFFFCVLPVMTAILTVLYVEGSRPLELDGQAESDASASDTPIFDLDERHYEGSTESIGNSVTSTSMKAQGECRNLESNIRLEATLQRLTHVLDELDEQLLTLGHTLKPCQVFIKRCHVPVTTRARGHRRGCTLAANMIVESHTWQCS
eukprot:s1351_g7.t1